MQQRLLRRREMLAKRCASRPAVERLLGGLRRLSNPQLVGYRVEKSLVLSEPFGALPTVVASAPADLAHKYVTRMLGRTPPAMLVATLAQFGSAALALVAGSDVRVIIVPAGRAFSQCSRSLASLVPDIDRWQAPPAGLFVLEERLLLVRSHALRMAAAHEFAHALDAVLATRPRSYFSFETQGVREAFASATGFVNEYAASGLDEYFAECVRAYVEVNDDRSSWLPLTRFDLAAKDARMFALIEHLFSGL